MALLIAWQARHGNSQVHVNTCFANDLEQVDSRKTGCKCHWHCGWDGVQTRLRTLTLTHSRYCYSSKAPFLSGSGLTVLEERYFLVTAYL